MRKLYKCINYVVLEGILEGKLVINSCLVFLVLDSFRFILIFLISFIVM